jgi:hypothetical protein
MTAPTQVRSWPHYLVGIALHVAIFLALGPLVGTFVFNFVVGGLTGGLKAATFTAALMAFVYPVAALGYVFGWKPALLTGLVVGALSPFVDASKHLYVLAIAVGVPASIVLVVGDWNQRPTLSVVLLAIGAAGAAAAAACTWLALRLPRPARGVEVGVK